MAKDYFVVWEIDIFDADSPEDAARRALVMQRDPQSIATAFKVWEKGAPIEQVHLVDFDEEDEIGNCVDCGTQCVDGGDGATVLCPQCDRKENQDPAI